MREPIGTPSARRPSIPGLWQRAIRPCCGLRVIPHRVHREVGGENRGGTRAFHVRFFKSHTGNPYFKKQSDGTLRHETEVAGDRAVEFLEGNPKGKPFCLSISFCASHAADWDLENHYPWPKAVDGMYDDVKIPSLRLSDPTIFANNTEFLKTSMNRKCYFWRWDTPEKYQKNMKAYFRMLSGIDRVIGRIRRELEQRGLADKTVIIYTADNGYYMGDRGFAGDPRYRKIHAARSKRCDELMNKYGNTEPANSLVKH